MTAELFSVFAAFPGLFTAVAFLVGACIGSFLNVVIVRLPAGESIVHPRSHCACGQPLAWRDNVPILSWLWLRGRARCCGRPISFRYLLVELLTAGLFLACWRLFAPPVAVCGWILVSGLVGATFIDLEHLIIPDVLTLGLGGAGVALSLLVPALHGQASGTFALDSLRSGELALVGMLIGSGLAFWIAMVAGAALKKEAMGFGDVKFVGAIGAFCGWHGAVFAIFGGAGVGTVWLGLMLAWRSLAGRKKQAPGGDAALDLGGHIPFGPMLAVAAALYFLALHPCVDAWFDNLATLF
jgi:leader peptidase (prepilin peptidase)/N-methyltransferase